MHPLSIHIHRRGPQSASGEAERLGFVLQWEAHSIHGSWTVWTDPSPTAWLEPGAFEVVTDDNWRVFEAAVGRVLQDRI